MKVQDAVQEGGERLSDHPRLAYVGFLANDRDIQGMLLVGWTLRVKFKSRYPIIVICLEDVSSRCCRLLTYEGMQVVKCNWKDLLHQAGIGEGLEKLMGGEWPVEILAKGLVLNLGIGLSTTKECQFERCLYLDSDLLIRESLDRLLETGEGSGEGHDLEMVPDYFLGLVSPDKQHHQIIINRNGNINSGVIRYRPGNELFREYLRQLLRLGGVGGQGVSVINNDQDVFNLMIREKKCRFRYLSLDYNVYSHLSDQMKTTGIITREIITHYIGSPKPWQWLEGMEIVLSLDTECKRERYLRWIKEWTQYLESRRVERAKYLLGDKPYILDRNGGLSLFKESS